MSWNPVHGLALLVVIAGLVCGAALLLGICMALGRFIERSRYPWATGIAVIAGIVLLLGGFLP